MTLFRFAIERIARKNQGWATTFGARLAHVRLAFTR
jgi:hypothetical protein